MKEQQKHKDQDQDQQKLKVCLKNGNIYQQGIKLRLKKEAIM